MRLILHIVQLSMRMHPIVISVVRFNMLQYRFPYWIKSFDQQEVRFPSPAKIGDITQLLADRAFQETHEQLC